MKKYFCMINYTKNLTFLNTTTNFSEAFPSSFGRYCDAANFGESSNRVQGSRRDTSQGDAFMGV